MTSTRQYSFAKNPPVPMPPKPIDVLEFHPGNPTEKPPAIELVKRPVDVVPGFKCTTHIFPAAFPRSRVGSARKISEPPIKFHLGARLTAEEIAVKADQWLAGNGKAAEVKLIDQNFIPATGLDEARLWMCGNRFVRNHTNHGKTLIFLHANGLHKETWEPTITALLNSPGGEDVDEIWSLDHFNQGESAVLNTGNLGTISNWTDCGRDLANFIMHYLPEKSSEASTVLPYMSANTLKTTFSSGPPSSHFLQQWRSHSLHGIGHSLGAASLTLAASMIPTLFHSLILVDSVVAPPIHEEILNKFTQNIVRGALKRRDVWNSRQEAKEDFLKKAAFFGRWDDRVLDLYVEYALMDLNDGRCTLKCHRDLEATIFADPHELFSTSIYSRFPMLSPSVCVNHVYPEDGYVVPTDMREYNFEASKHVKNSRKIVLVSDENGIPGHLIAQESPERLGELIGKLLLPNPNIGIPAYKL